MPSKSLSVIHRDRLARGSFDTQSDTITLLRGSILTINLDRTPPANIRSNYNKLRRYVEEGLVRKQKDGRLEAVRDIPGLSPSEARVFADGKAGSGWSAWVLPNGKPLDSLRSSPTQISTPRKGAPKEPSSTEVAPMLYLTHPPFRQLIRAIPVTEHSVEVGAEFWLSLCASAGRSDEHAAIFKGQQKVRISRQWLHNATNVSPTSRCLAILMWGYPTGARGSHKKWLTALPEIAQKAASVGPTWQDYYARLAETGGLGISTISKLACFFGQRFEGHRAQVLDKRILRVLESGRWAELGDLRDIRYENAHVHYPRYLKTLAQIGIDGEMSPEQIEFFLFALGHCF